MKERRPSGEPVLAEVGPPVILSLGIAGYCSVLRTLRRAVKTAAGSIVLALAAGACVGPFSEDFESHYATVAAARSAGAFDRGWLPEIIPADATEISEIHNIDTNVTWACFSIPHGPEGTRELLEKGGWRKASGPIGGGPRTAFAVREWWPASMSERTIEAYETRERISERVTFSIVVGIDTASKRVCIHRS